MQRSGDVTTSGTPRARVRSRPSEQRGRAQAILGVTLTLTTSCHHAHETVLERENNELGHEIYLCLLLEYVDSKVLKYATPPPLGEQAILCSKAAMFDPPEHHAHETVLDRQSNEHRLELCLYSLLEYMDYNALYYTPPPTPGPTGHSMQQGGDVTTSGTPRARDRFRTSEQRAFGFPLNPLYSLYFFTRVNPS